MPWSSHMLTSPGAGSIWGGRYRFHVFSPGDAYHPPCVISLSWMTLGIPGAQHSDATSLFCMIHVWGLTISPLASVMTPARLTLLSTAVPIQWSPVLA